MPQIEFEKEYDSDEEDLRRMEIFKENSKLIDDHNKGHFTYELGHNQFSDLTYEEYLGKCPIF